MNIYTPQENPHKAFLMISVIVLLGIIGGYYVQPYVLAFALLFWIQYTAILSYKQFKGGHKHSFDSITEMFLNYQLRFFLFEVIAFMGLIALAVYNSLIFGVGALVIWWGFALNFFMHYKK